MLGLEYGTVALVDHDVEWAREFEDERRRLGRALADVPCEIEHVGSTAVVGLIAKPILDIAIGIACAPGTCIAPLEALGYIDRGDAGARGGHLLVRESEARVRTHHVHLVDLGGPQWRSYLALRGYLRANPDARDRYAATKQELADRFATDRTAYTAGKDAIIAELLDAARDRA